MLAPAALPFSFSQVPGSPSFRSSAVNTVALVPLLSSDKDGEIATTKSAQSFRDLFEALRRHATSASDSPTEEDLLLVIPNSSLTRPGDWRYNDTPLKAFHWQHGCQRLHLFDGRPDFSRLAHDRLINHSVTRDWIDLVPSRRTAAVIGIINLRDCKDLADLHRAEEELHQWATRFATPPYEVTAHGRSFDRDKPVERLFVFDSFDEECQKIDLSKSNMGNSILAFPPAGEAHSQMMDLHLNVVVNDLAVAIFRTIETKIRDSGEISKGSSSLTTQPAERRYLSRIISGSGETAGDEPVQSSTKLSIGNIASLMSPESKLAQDASARKSNKFSNLAARKSNKFSNLADSASKAISSSSNNIPSTATPQLLTPMDDIWDHSELSPSDADAFRKREIGRREKFAADLSLLAGSPIDAYERYLKAAELCKTGTPDPLWYASAMIGCAAAHIAMAEAGGYSVDDYLENNFQLPEEIMALAKKEPKEEKGRQAATTAKQTFPEVVFALSEEAMSILNRHTKLAPFHAELLLKLAWYSSESAESHLRCRWGEGEGCHAGEPNEPPRWERTSVSKLKFGELKTKDGEDMIGFSTFNRVKKVCELLQQAVSVGDLDPATRVDVASRSARMCLDGVKATQWKKVDTSRIELPRKAAFFAAVAAEAVSSADRDGTLHLARDLWLLASQLYSSKPNARPLKGSYGWTTLRASILHALSLQGNSLLSHEAAELVLSLLGDISPEIPEEGTTDGDKKTSKETKEHETDHMGGTSYSDSGVLDTHTGARREEVDDLVSAAISSTFATKIRHSFTTMTASTSILTVQSKWVDDEAIKSVDVPLAEPSEIASSVLALGCVWSQVDYSGCSLAQKSCMERILTLRRALPASSTKSSTSLIKDSGGSILPLYVSSAMAIQVDSTLELEFVKLSKSPVKAKEGAMATFYNPYENKGKADKVEATRVAEEEERAMLIQFGNRLSLPLEVRRCQLEFENNEAGRVKATALAFTIPPKATGFVVHFPFTVLSELSTDAPSESKAKDSFEVKGMTLTCLGRSIYLPISTAASNIDTGSGSMPKPASTYPYASAKKVPEDAQDDKPRIEASPCQPSLQVFNAASGAPVAADSAITINLSDGEIFTVPSWRLENYSGPSTRGNIERLLISVNGLSGSSDQVLYDSDSGAAVGADDSDETFFQEPVSGEKTQPIKLRTLVSSLELGSKTGVAQRGTVRLQVAAAHNMSSQIPKGSTVRIRFRYRGLSNAVNEVWRTREIVIHIVPINGPCITSLVFRPDLARNSAYTKLRKSIIVKSTNKHEGADEQADNISKDESFLCSRVGLDAGTYVCSNDVIFLLTMTNTTSSDITLSSPTGTVGGFEDNRLPTILVHAGVSAKIPVVIPRIPRVNESGTTVDLVSELVAKTKLVWETKRRHSGGDVVAKGHIHIPPACLKDIMYRQPSFVSQICEPPLRIKLTADGKNPDSLFLLSLGTPLEVSVQVEVAPWLSQEAIENCTVKLELCCSRKDNSNSSNAKGDSRREFIWCGKQQQKMPMQDPNKVHSARIAFVQTGDFCVSACVRIYRTDIVHRVEEIWFAPTAATVTIQKSRPAQ